MNCPNQTKNSQQNLTLEKQIESLILNVLDEDKVEDPKPIKNIFQPNPNQMLLNQYAMLKNQQNMNCQPNYPFGNDYRLSFCYNNNNNRQQMFNMGNQNSYEMSRLRMSPLERPSMRLSIPQMNQKIQENQNRNSLNEYVRVVSNSSMSTGLGSENYPLSRRWTEDLTVSLEDKIKEEENTEPNKELENLLKLKGNFLKVITSQNGSRMLQRSIFNSDKSTLMELFTEIEFNIPELMIDPYANYFCQKFFGCLGKNEKIRFLKNLKNDFFDISNSKIGTYPLQAIIDQICSQDEINILINSVEGKVIDLCLNSQGVHVIEKIIICFGERKVSPIFRAILDDFVTLANNVNGLCVIKKVIASVETMESKQKICHIIVDNALELVQNAYGNYAIQVFYDHWDKDSLTAVAKQFFNKFYVLSMQKYSSNVIEKCLETTDDIVLTKFIDEICQFNRVVDLMKNCYGNYVVQKALKIAKGTSRTKLANTIVKNIDKLGEKKLVSKWRTIVNSNIGKSVTMQSIKMTHSPVLKSPVKERSEQIKICAPVIRRSSKSVITKSKRSGKEFYSLFSDNNNNNPFF